MTARLSTNIDLTVVIKLLSYAILIVGAIVMLMPFIWMITTACKPPQELASLPVRVLPDNPVCFENARALYDQSEDFNRYLLNSAFVTIARTLGQLVTCSLAAYGFARFRFPGRGIIFALCLGLLMVPFQAILIPEFILMRNLTWLNTFRALIIPGIFSAFALFLLRQAFLQIPLELEEAALVDGCSRYRIFWSIVLPLSKPGLVATFILVLIMAWNEYLFALFLSSANAQTLPLTVAAQNATRGPQWWYMSVLIIVMILPVVMLAILLARYITRGLLIGAVKG